MVVEGPKAVAPDPLSRFHFAGHHKSLVQNQNEDSTSVSAEWKSCDTPEVGTIFLFLEHVQHSTRVAYGYQVHVSLITGIWVRKIGSWKGGGEYA